MNFAILINGAPYTSQASLSAYHFAKSIISKKHTIQQTFFYLDGVTHANNLIYCPTDEFQLISAWEKLAHDGQFDLAICSTAALKRGILNQELAEQFHKENTNFYNAFKMATLIQFLDNATQADRFITFGA